MSAAPPAWSARAAGPGDPGRGFLIPALVLVAIGTVMIYSATVNDAQAGYQVRPAFLQRHLAYAALGLVAYAVAAGADYRRVLDRARGWILLAFALLAAVWLPGVGVEVHGARRWIGRPITVQPAEFAKVLLLLYLVDFSWRKIAARESWRGLLPALGCSGGMAVLVLAQPDYGTAVVLLLHSLVVLWLGARSTSKVTALALSAVPVLLTLVLVSPYRAERLVSFLHPERDPLGGSYQLRQSLDCFRRGGWTGVGIGRAIAPQGYVFSSYADFVLATVAEELGLLGVAGVILAYLWIARGAWRIASTCPDPRGTHLALGAAALVLMQAAINLFVVVGLLPTKGLALPLVSYGGSSLVATMALLGLVRSVSRWGVFSETRNSPAGGAPI